MHKAAEFLELLVHPLDIPSDSKFTVQSRSYPIRNQTTSSIRSHRPIFWVNPTDLQVFSNQQYQLIPRIQPIFSPPHSIPFLKSLTLHNAPAAPPAFPRILRAPLFRLAPNRSLAASKNPFTNSLLPTTAPSVKYRIFHCNIFEIATSRAVVRRSNSSSAVARSIPFRKTFFLTSPSAVTSSFETSCPSCNNNIRYPFETFPGQCRASASQPFSAPIARTNPARARAPVLPPTAPIASP